MIRRAGAWLAALALLSACGRIIPPPDHGAPVHTRPPVTANALQAGVRRGPPVSSLVASAPGSRAALRAFAASCARMALRGDASGLTLPQDWAAPCQAAAAWPQDDAARFFATWFETVMVGAGTTYVTGYYEPEIAGARSHLPGFDIPVYRLPPDLVRARPGDAVPNADGREPLGRYDANGIFVPYWDRAQIEDGALAGQGLEIAWAADPAELFFLQVQGSGRLRAPDGTIMRIGYAGENGWAYTGIGSLMSASALIGTGPGQYAGSMQGILRYIRENPAQGRALMRQNRSFIFFRDTTAIAGDPNTGPVGALSVPVTPRVTLAADPAFVPLGAPVLLTTDRAEVAGLWVTQDTGGAIKGANRFDSFWGAGADARRIAGGMSARGTALVLVPKGTFARLPHR
ncbi:murein transglycosylase A [Novosphingobium sp.]|uniref:murein transglycosylase A n=1 Tax=Novosphingobium sp. TaxID=1874826 RepID=UPI003341197D